jgi:tripartite-type tricarboxylate transporter receptor subunit TctC
MARLETLKRLVACAATLAATLAFAQPYPAKPVKVIVPFAPGGNLDVTARLLGEHMAKTLGQPVVVENRAGAGGAIGSEVVAKAAPDGYTLVIGTSGTMVVSPLLVPNAPYQLASFSAIGMAAVTPLVLEVPAASPHRDFRAFLAHVKANPGKVTIGHSGNGTTNHIAILQLQDALKVDWVVVPYKGSGPALIDLVGGQIDSMIDQTSSSLPQIQGGKLRALAVGTPSRIADLPNVPTLQEEGVANFVAMTPSGFFAPAGTPPEVIRTLSAALNKALEDPAVRKRLAELGSVVRVTTPAEFERFMKEEETKLKALAATACSSRRAFFEGGVVAFSRRGFDPLDARLLGPLAGPSRDRLHRWRVSLDHGFDSAVGAVAHPSRHAQARRLLAHGFAEPNALHQPVDREPARDALSHRGRRARAGACARPPASCPRCGASSMPSWAWWGCASSARS